MVSDTTFHRETIVDRFLSGGSPTGGRLGSRDGGGSSTGGPSWDGGSLTGGCLRRGSLIGVFFRFFISSTILLSKREVSRSTLAQSRWPFYRAGRWVVRGVTVVCLVYLDRGTR
jgi:hypothetical protein